MLKVTNLNYTVDGTQILHDVSLEVHPGEFVGILGPNGSGKSTLLKNIYKVLKPQSGAIELQGKNLLAMSNREMAQHLAVVGQEHEGSFDFLVEEVVLMGCQARKRLTEGFDESDRQAAMKALRRVELEHLSQRSYLSLSGGEKQRVMIARALVQDTPLMILDEPTNHLDIASREWVEAAIEEFEGVLLFVSHDRYFIENLRSVFGSWRMEPSGISGAVIRNTAPFWSMRPPQSRL